MEGLTARQSEGRNKGIFGKRKSVWQDVEEKRSWLHKKPALKVDVGWVDMGLQQATK